METATITKPRSRGIGASEISAVLGINQYKTPLKLWRIKVGLDEDDEGNVFTIAGNMLENAVADYFQEFSGHRVIKRSAKVYSVDHPTLSHIFCSPDREYFDKEGGKGVLECKTTQKDIDKDDFPLDWFCQLQYQMGILGLKKGAIAWLKRGLDFDYMEFDFDQEFFDTLVLRATDFWENHVLAGVEPPMINEDDVNLKYPVSTELVIEATDEMVEVYHDIVKLDTEIKEKTKKLDFMKEQVKLSMKDAGRVDYSGQTLFTWKTSKDSFIVDGDKLEKNYPEVYKDVLKKKASSRPFLIKK
jgi:putative phage-type endonuclease